MAYQQTQTATEYRCFLQDSHRFREVLLSEKVSALKRGLLIPDALIAELEDFAKRNSLKDVTNTDYLTQEPNEVCPHCMKAHAVTHALELGVPKESAELIGSILPGNLGHDGYYLDEGEVKKTSPL